MLPTWNLFLEESRAFNETDIEEVKKKFYNRCMTYSKELMNVKFNFTYQTFDDIHRDILIMLFSYYDRTRVIRVSMSEFE